MTTIVPNATIMQTELPIPEPTSFDDVEYHEIIHLESSAECKKRKKILEEVLPENIKAIIVRI